MTKNEVAQQVAELRQVYQHDFQRFASDCLKIRTKVDGIQPFVLNEAQQDFVRRYERQMAETGKLTQRLELQRQVLETQVTVLLYRFCIGLRCRAQETKRI